MGSSGARLSNVKGWGLIRLWQKVRLHIQPCPKGHVLAGTTKVPELHYCCETFYTGSGWLNLTYTCGLCKHIKPQPNLHSRHLPCSTRTRPLTTQGKKANVQPTKSFSSSLGVHILPFLCSLLLKCPRQLPYQPIPTYVALLPCKSLGGGDTRNHSPLINNQMP